MLITRLFAALSGAMAALPAAALTVEEAAAQNMDLAAELCLRNYYTGPAMTEAFREAGFTLVPGLDAGSWDIDAPGVNGVIVPGTSEAYCFVQSNVVPFDRARQIAWDLAYRTMPDATHEGHPENRPVACPTLSIFAPRRLIVVEVTNAGNGGGCSAPQSSAIVLRM